MGDGWEGVKGLALALSEHTSPRNSPRNDDSDANAGVGGGLITGTVNNNTNEIPITTENGSSSNSGSSVVVSGNRARSMFAQRLKASTPSTAVPAPAPSSKGQQQTEG